MKVKFLLLFFTLQLLAGIVYSQSYVKITIDSTADLRLDNSFNISVEFDNKKGKKIKKNVNYLYSNYGLKRMNLKVSGGYFDYERCKLFLHDKGHIDSNLLVLSYNHPRLRNIIQSDTIPIPVITNYTVNQHQINYAQTVKPVFNFYFTDGSIISKKEIELMQFLRHNGLEFEFTNGVIYEDGSVRLNDFNNTLDDAYLGITCLSHTEFGTCKIPFSLSGSYYFSYQGSDGLSGDKGYNGGNGQQGCNVQILVQQIDVSDSLFSFRIIPTSTADTISFVSKPHKFDLTVDASGGKGGDGGAGYRGADAPDDVTNEEELFYGEPGGSGGHGGNGGEGGNVTIISPYCFESFTGAINIKSHGGSGGSGGSGGKGGRNQTPPNEKVTLLGILFPDRAEFGEDGYDGQNGGNGIVEYIYY